LFYFALFFNYSLSLTRRSILRRSVGSLLSFVSPIDRLTGLHFPLFFYARSSLFHRLLRDTHHSDGSTVVFWLYRRLQRPCGLPVTGVWQSHAREILFLSWAWRSHSVFFRRAKVALEDMEVVLMFGKLQGWHVSYTRRAPAMTVSLLPAWVDFMLDVCLCNPLFLYIVCLCMAQILL